MTPHLAPSIWRGRRIVKPRTAKTEMRRPWMIASLQPGLPSPGPEEDRAGLEEGLEASSSSSAPVTVTNGDRQRF